MTLGIVILNYNDATETKGLVERIKDYPAIEHILVVDNKSSDDSWETLSACVDDSWELISSGENRGYAFGNNVGIRYLVEKYNVDLVAVSNPDVEFDNTFIESIKKDFEMYPGYAILSGVQLTPQGKPHWHAFWKEHDKKSCYVDILKSVPRLGRYFRKKYRLENYVPESLQGATEVFPVDVIGGCLFFARSEDIMQVGCFDENTFLYFEEDILAKRIKATNKKIGVDPKLEFVHKCSESINKVASEKRKAKAMMTSQRYFFKNYVTKSKASLLWRDFLAKFYLLTLSVLEPLILRKKKREKDNRERQQA